MINRIVTAVFPSIDDDVITSPYNTVLGMNQLTELADCVLPIDNGALVNIVNRTNANKKKDFTSGDAVKHPESSLKDNCSRNKSKPFDEMNGIVAGMLLNLTRLDQVFSDAFTRDLQLVSADPQRHTFLASALLLRGDVSVSDMRRNIERLQPRLRFIPWNREGWKVGHCLVPPVRQPYSLLALSNNTAVREGFSLILERFNKLYRRKAHLHHYSAVSGFDSSLFQSSSESLSELLAAYKTFEEQAQDNCVPTFPRLQIAD